VRFGRLMAILAATVTMAVLAVAPSANAATYLTWHAYWRIAGCLDQNDSAGVFFNHCYADDAWQKWEVKYYADGTARFMSTGSKMCLDASEYGVRGFGCNDLSYQRWKINGWGDGSYELVNQFTHHCLDVSEYGVRTVGCNGLYFQRWYTA
jgi:hypothetical protein